MTGSIDRVTADDLVALATDVGPVPMQVGAVLLVAPTTRLDPSTVRSALEERIRSVPRLRQRLVSTPVGCGRPVWVDGPDFDLTHHFATVTCPGSGDEQDLLAMAADVVTTRLRLDRPLWSMTLVAGLDRGQVALIVVFHHVLADGIGGLAVLANLVDGGADSAGSSFPRPAPTNRDLAFDSVRTRVESLRHLPGSLPKLRDAFLQLRAAGRGRAARSSLNRPTGPNRRLDVVSVALEDVYRIAHDHGATVNDVVLAAVTAALRTVLSSRGESITRFVVSIPVSARRSASATQLGNEVGAVPVHLPASGDPLDRLAEIAAVTKEAKRTTRAASAAVLGPLFRLLARLGIFRWFIDRQHLVHTFVTNLRGPETQLRFLGAPITKVLPIAVITGNVTVSFAVLSYAGTLGITLIADPDACPDLERLTEALRAELDALRTGFGP